MKKDTTLVQHRDFELVPDSLWKALALWYGGSLPLPRQVIRPPGSHEVELELYPVNLHILKHQSQVGPSATWSSVVGGYVLRKKNNITFTYCLLFLFLDRG